MCDVMRSPTFDLRAHPLKGAAAVGRRRAMNNNNNSSAAAYLLGRSTYSGNVRTVGQHNNMSPPPSAHNCKTTTTTTTRGGDLRIEADVDTTLSCGQITTSPSSRGDLLQRSGRLLMEIAAVTCSPPKKKNNTDQQHQQQPSGRPVSPPPSTVKLPVTISVYRTPYDQYLVVSQDRVVRNDCGYVNLKRCRVRVVEQRAAAAAAKTEFALQITSRDCDRPPLVLHAANARELEEWIRTLEECTEDETTKAENVATSPLGAECVRLRSGTANSGSSSNRKSYLSLSALEEEEEEEEEGEEEE